MSSLKKLWTRERDGPAVLHCSQPNPIHPTPTSTDVPRLEKATRTRQEMLALQLILPLPRPPRPAVQQPRLRKRPRLEPPHLLLHRLGRALVPPLLQLAWPPVLAPPGPIARHGGRRRLARFPEIYNTCVYIPVNHPEGRSVQPTETQTQIKTASHAPAVGPRVNVEPFLRSHPLGRQMLPRVLLRWPPAPAPSLRPTTATPAAALCVCAPALLARGGAR